MNIQKLMKEAQKAQKKAAEVQERLGSMQITVQAGGGLIEATVNGHGKIMGISVKPEALTDRETLEDLLLIALKGAQDKAHEVSEKEMERELGGIGNMLGGMF